MREWSSSRTHWRSMIAAKCQTHGRATRSGTTRPTVATAIAVLGIQTAAMQAKSSTVAMNSLDVSNPACVCRRRQCPRIGRVRASGTRTGVIAIARAEHGTQTVTWTRSSRAAPWQPVPSNAQTLPSSVSPLRGPATRVGMRRRTDAIATVACGIQTAMTRALNSTTATTSKQTMQCAWNRASALSLAGIALQFGTARVMDFVTATAGASILTVLTQRHLSLAFGVAPRTPSPARTLRANSIPPTYPQCSLRQSPTSHAPPNRSRHA
mmetsp:Transcript_13082/g.38419  ORF Transcript_13082/g.38419 Transcript_13082/m.38419 type:complete len:267 (+) Transcript_13082:911-1711(+)